MNSEFIVVESRSRYSGENITLDRLRSRRLYKALSLLESRRAGIKIPPVLLLLEPSFGSIEDIVSSWSLPLMIRMDYTARPTSKPLGGIPIYSVNGIKSLSRHLFGNGLYPLWHTHIDRFADIYSAGLVLTKGNSEIQVELVGKGFDASDLRLGIATPHESFSYNIADDSLSNRHLIGIDLYHSQRVERTRRVAELRCYIDFANRESRLLSSLNRFEPSRADISKASEDIPTRYTPLGRREIQALAGYAFLLQTQVLPSLPNSERFVASFSYIPKSGWILWDVYGHWYDR